MQIFHGPWRIPPAFPKNDDSSWISSTTWPPVTGVTKDSPVSEDQVVGQGETLQPQSALSASQTRGAFRGRDRRCTYFRLCGYFCRDWSWQCRPTAIQYFEASTRLTPRRSAQESSSLEFLVIRNMGRNYSARLRRKGKQKSAWQAYRVLAGNQPDPTTNTNNIVTRRPSAGIMIRRLATHRPVHSYMAGKLAGRRDSARCRNAGRSMYRSASCGRMANDGFSSSTGFISRAIRELNKMDNQTVAFLSTVLLVLPAL
nr:hypothetical protein CFP56_73883 [Quercus suber]